MKHLRISALCIFLCSIGSIHIGNTADIALFSPTQHGTQVSTSSIDTFQFARPNRFLSSQGFRITGIGIPLLAGSVLVNNTNQRIKELRDNSIPSFHSRYDDWLQYAPAAVMVGLKAAGVSGRSSWGRMLTSDAFSVTAMAILVNTLKYSVKKERPDGSATNSYPSGHAATAFMTATMLSREYAGRSLWYSVGAYTAATAVSIGRLANNRHWAGDVLAGAGIGIISTELGYWIADQIFKEKGIDHRYELQNALQISERPSFFGIYLGSRKTLGTYHATDGTELSFSTSSTTGLEGAWFPSRYIGIGSRLSLTGMPITTRNSQNDYFYQISASVGSYFSYPIGSVLALGGRVVVGYSRYERGASSSGIVPLKSPNGVNLESGLAVQLHLRQHFGFRICFDYQTGDSPFGRSSHWLHTLSYGASANVLF